MQTPRLGSGRLAEPALAVYLAPCAASRRALWVGSRHGGGAAHLAAAGANVLVAQPAEPAMAREGADGPVRWRRWEPGHLPIRDGEQFDLVVAVSPLDEPSLAQIEAALEPNGLLLLGAEDVEAVTRLHRRLQRSFPRVAVLGEAPFSAVALARLGEPPGDDVLIDGRLLEGAPQQPPRRLYVLAGARWPSDLPTYGLIATPTEASPSANGFDAAAQSPLEHPGSGAPSTPRRPRPEHAVPAHEEAPSQRGAETIPPEVAREIRRLESLLRDRAEEVRELRGEVERRGRLARDLTERLRELAGSPARASSSEAEGRGPRDSELLERALDAEGRAEAARFENDELRARLAELLDEGVELRLARLEGEARGWRARVAELQELYETARGRVLLLEADLRERNEAIQALQRELQLTTERFEAELARAHVREAADSQRGEALLALRGRVEGLHRRLLEREGALSTWKERAGTLQRELQGREQRLDDLERILSERAALVTRLQLDLADEERRAEALARRTRKLEEEVQGLRTALLEAAQGGADSETEETKALRARLQRLEADLAKERERTEGAERARQRAEAAARRARTDLESVERERDQLRTEYGNLEARRVAVAQRLEEAQHALRQAEREQGYLEERLRRAEEERREMKVRLEALGARLERNQKELETLRRAEGAQESLRAVQRELQEIRSERDRLRTLLDEHRRTEAARRREMREEAERRETLQRRVDALRAERDTLRTTLEQLRAELAAMVEPDAEHKPHHITAVGMEAPGVSKEEELRRRLEAMERDLRDHRTLIETLTAQVEERDRRIREMRRAASSPPTEASPQEEALRRELLAVQSRLARLQEELALEREARRAAEATSTAGGIPSPDRDDARRTARNALNVVEELLARARARGDEEDASRLASVMEQLARL